MDAAGNDAEGGGGEVLFEPTAPVVGIGKGMFNHAAGTSQNKTELRIEVGCAIRSPSTCR